MAATDTKIHDFAKLSTIVLLENPKQNIFNSQSARLNNLNFHPLEVVSRHRDPQPKAIENYKIIV